MPGKPENARLQHPPPGEAVLPLPRHMRGRDWARRGAIWGALGIAFALLVYFDVALMQWRYRWIPEEPPGWARQVLMGFRDFAQVVPIVTAIAIVLQIDRRRWFIVAAILLAQVLAGIVYNVGKFGVVRSRPYAALVETLATQPGDTPEVMPGADVDPDLPVPRSVDFSPTWEGVQFSLRGEDSRSFPSGHSAAAFAFAGVLAWFYPRLRWTFWVLAAGCATSRYLDAMHWPSDCLAGAVVGYAGAWLALRPYVWALPVIYWRRRVKRRVAAARGA